MEMAEWQLLHSDTHTHTHCTLSDLYWFAWQTSTCGSFYFGKRFCCLRLTPNFYLFFFFFPGFRLQKTLPAGRSFVAMDTKQIPQILQQIFTSTMLSSAWDWHTHTQSLSHNFTLCPASSHDVSLTHFVHHTGRLYHSCIGSGDSPFVRSWGGDSIVLIVLQKPQCDGVVFVWYSWRMLSCCAVPPGKRYCTTWLFSTVA